MNDTAAIIDAPHIFIKAPAVMKYAVEIIIDIIDLPGGNYFLR
jgi:hypothetical protein